jgi:hypothetical protein
MIPSLDSLVVSSVLDEYMEYEIFTKKDGKKYVVFKNATFASSKNYNGAHFDPLEIFAIDVAPNEFNQSHKQDKTLKAEFTNKVEPKIEGRLLRFTSDIMSDDEYVVENADKVTGFSPELFKVNEPAVRGDERFYANGDLQWKRTAILFGEKAGFVGADQFDLEKFDVTEGDDIVLVETKPVEDEQETATTEDDDTQETKEAVDQADKKVDGEDKPANEEAQGEEKSEEFKALEARVADLEAKLVKETKEQETFDKIKAEAVQSKQATKIDVEDAEEFSKGAKQGKGTEAQLAEIYKISRT